MIFYPFHNTLSAKSVLDDKCNPRGYLPDAIEANDKTTVFLISTDEGKTFLPNVYSYTEALRMERLQSL